MTGLRLYLAIGAAVALILGAGALYLTGRKDGAAAGKAEIIKQIGKDNDNAGKAADDWRTAFRDCVHGGGLFDFERGTCEH